MTAFGKLHSLQGVMTIFCVHAAPGAPPNELATQETLVRLASWGAVRGHSSTSMLAQSPRRSRGPVRRDWHTS